MNIFDITAKFFLNCLRLVSWIRFLSDTASQSHLHATSSSNSTLQLQLRNASLSKTIHSQELGRSKFDLDSYSPYVSHSTIKLAFARDVAMLGKKDSPLISLISKAAALTTQEALVSRDSTEPPTEVPSKNFALKPIILVAMLRGASTPEPADATRRLLPGSTSAGRPTTSQPTMRTRRQTSPPQSAEEYLRYPQSRCYTAISTNLSWFNSSVLGSDSCSGSSTGVADDSSAKPSGSASVPDLAREAWRRLQEAAVLAQNLTSVIEISVRADAVVRSWQNKSLIDGARNSSYGSNSSMVAETVYRRVALALNYLEQGLHDGLQPCPPWHNVTAHYNSLRNKLLRAECTLSEILGSRGIPVPMVLRAAMPWAHRVFGNGDQRLRRDYVVASDVKFLLRSSTQAINEAVWSS